MIFFFSSWVLQAGLFSTVGCVSDCRSSRRKLESQFGHITLVKHDHEIISRVILLLPLNQEDQLPVTGGSMVNLFES